jgi:hypothetical protein
MGFHPSYTAVRMRTHAQVVDSKRNPLRPDFMVNGGTAAMPRRRSALTGCGWSGKPTLKPRSAGSGIRDEADYRAHVDYCHFNPVKHGLAAHPAAWPYSSFHAHVRAGLYPPEWAVEPPEAAGYGERE